MFLRGIKGFTEGLLSLLVEGVCGTFGNKILDLPKIEGKRVWSERRSSVLSLWTLSKLCLQKLTVEIEKEGPY